MITKFAVMAMVTVLVAAGAAHIGQAQGQMATFDRSYVDIKFLDAYFGTVDEKIEVDPGDGRVPFTISMANVGTADITGVRGELYMPFGFSSIDDDGPTIQANAESNVRAGEIFSITFFVDLSDELDINQYPATVKVDYSRIRESGVRMDYFGFDFRVTGSGVINVNAQHPFLTALQHNTFGIIISNNGTAPISGVSAEIAEFSDSKVAIPETDWPVGSIKPGETRHLSGSIYVPDLSGEILQLPLEITYFDAYGEQHTITRNVDFYVLGLIDIRVGDVDVLEVSDTPTITGQITNEGNENALYGSITLKPKDDSNIREVSYPVDEIHIDTPVRFEIEVEFDGAPQYGEHEVEFVVRYKDTLRSEYFVSHSEMITIPEGVRSSSFDRSLQVTGGSVINVNAENVFLTALQENEFAIEMSNSGTEPISGVKVEITESSGDRIVIPDTDWNVGQMSAGETKHLPGTVYVPELATGETFSLPLEITYFDAYGDRQTIERSVDFYVQGLIDVDIYNISVLEFSGTPTVIGEIINEGNENALFGFVTLKPGENSNIVETAQFIDEIETDSPVPFNIPVSFDGAPQYGEHEVDIVVRYKDPFRGEYFETYTDTITVPEPAINGADGNGEGNEDSMALILGVAAVVSAIIGYAAYRRKRRIKIEI